MPISNPVNLAPSLDALKADLLADIAAKHGTTQTAVSDSAGATQLAVASESGEVEALVSAEAQATRADVASEAAQTRYGIEAVRGAEVPTVATPLNGFRYPELVASQINNDAYQPQINYTGSGIITFLELTEHMDVRIVIDGNEVLNVQGLEDSTTKKTPVRADNSNGMQGLRFNQSLFIEARKASPGASSSHTLVVRGTLFS